MSENQKAVAAWFAVSMLVLALGATAILAVQAQNGTYLDRSNPVYAPSSAWAIAIWFIKNGAALNTIFALFLAVLSAAVTIAGDAYKSKMQIASIVALSLMGVAAAILILSKMDHGEALNDLRYFGDFTGLDNARVASLLNGFIYPVIAWFSLFLATALGMATLAKDGAVKAILK